MTSRRTKLQEGTHFRVGHLLQENPDMSQRERADVVGISVGGTHYALNTLIEKGFVKLGNFTEPEYKWRYPFVLTQKGIARKAALTRAFLVRETAECEALRKEIEALAAEVDDNPKLIGLK